MTKIVKLSLHKNTLEKRKDKEFRGTAVKHFKECINKPGLQGYAIAVWDKEGKTTSCLSVGKDSPITRSLLPEHLKTIFLDRFITD